MSSTDITLEQGGTVRALYMAITKTKPWHDSSHTISSSNNIKTRQMICSKAHQGDAHKTPKWIIAQKDPKPPSLTFADLYRARARAAVGKPPEAVNVPGNNLKPQWEVVHMGWGNPKSNIEPSNPKHPHYVAPSPDKHEMDPQPGYLFGQSAHQYTDDDESIHDGTYDVNNLEEEDTYEFAEGGHY
jgi:hypothetical protein